MKNRHLLIIGTCLVITGLILGRSAFTQYFGSVFGDSKTGFVVSQPVEVKEQIRVEGKPKHLSIPSLNIDLPVIDGFYDAQNQTWTLSEDSVHYAVDTPKVNNIADNTFLYGHNNTLVFSNLHKIKKGDELRITAKNGRVFTYTYTQSYVTSPNDNSVFQYSGQPIVTIQTCSGLWFEDRQLFVFKFVGVV